MLTAVQATRVRELKDNFDYYATDVGRVVQTLNDMFIISLRFVTWDNDWNLVIDTGDDNIEVFTHVNLPQVIEDALEWLDGLNNSNE